MLSLRLTDPTSGGERSRLHHRARILLQHYPRSAVSDVGSAAAREYLASGASAAAYTLDTLPPELFVPYVRPLRQSLDWSEPLWGRVLESVAVVESMLGCVHGCGMCYIDAPRQELGESMPWPHMVEVLNEVAAQRRYVLRSEVSDVLVNDLLRGRLTASSTILDGALALVRHSRNRFANYSDHLICYWKSNPTNWTDALFGRDYADVCHAVVDAFQLFRTEELIAAIDRDPVAHSRFHREFGEDIARLHFATSTHAVTSTVPFAQGSLGDRAVARILASSPLGSELVRVSIPHPNLIRTGSGNPGRYWTAVQYSLRSARPKLVYVFASTLDELVEVFEHISGCFEQSSHPWWIESRLGLYEIREGRKRQESDHAIVGRLKRTLRRLGFVGTLEGRAKQYEGSPLFTAKGTVMCVNGVVVAPGRKLHFQSCTDESGSDLPTGQIIENLHGMDERYVSHLVGTFPLTNRARELITPGLSNIPPHEIRKPPQWFLSTMHANRIDPRFEDALKVVTPIAEALQRIIRF